MNIKAKKSKKETATQMLKRLTKFQKEVNVIIDQIANSRDKLRDKIAEFDEIRESADMALEDLASAKRSFSYALEELSKYL